MRADGTEAGAQPLTRALSLYAEAIGPWASATAATMLADVSRRNLGSWRERGLGISRGLRQEIEATPVGREMREMLASQVGLIKSLPLRAAEDVHAMVQQGMLVSTRSTDIAERILESSSVPAYRARRIARTEVSRASSTLTQARAQAIGSEGYVWRTVKDGDVRRTHRALEGKYIPWATPPKTDAGLAPYHAGCGPNCRCYPEPVLPQY